LQTVRDNGGGYVNHAMFWNIRGPDGGGADWRDLVCHQPSAALQHSSSGSTTLGETFR